MDSMFTERDPLVHRALKGSVAQLFSMTNMRNFEVYADECTKIFLDAMEDLEGKSVDFATWLQWYAFDVIGGITFQRRFGFMEQRGDVDSMIRKIDEGLEYVKVIGQSEWLVALFDVLSRNDWITHSKLWPDTMERFLQVRTCYAVTRKRSANVPFRLPKRNWPGTMAMGKITRAQIFYRSCEQIRKSRVTFRTEIWLITCQIICKFIKSGVDNMFLTR
jgi:hypothetical protein